MKHKKQLIIVVSIVVLVAILISCLIVTQLSKAIVISKNRHIYRNAVTVNTAILKYHEEHGSYPVGTDVESLASQIEPRAGKQARSWEVKYTSNGESYELRFPALRGEFVFRNGKVVVAPDYMKDYIGKSR